MKEDFAANFACHSSFAKILGLISRCRVACASYKIINTGEAGALEIHVRISSPPVKWPCFYGIDFASRAELIASGLEVEEIRRSIGADSLSYVSLEGLISATEIAEEKLCTACFTGSYPITIPHDMSEGKFRLEVTEVSRS